MNPRQSTDSASTGYSYEKQPASASSSSKSKPHRSVRDRVKGVVSDMGYPPTRRYDQENGRKTERPDMSAVSYPVRHT